jgi:hypothetical protein
MKKFLVVLVFIGSVFGCEAIWNNGPTGLLKDIFTITETDGVKNLDTAIKQSNFRWIRPKGLERWDVYSLFDSTVRSALTKKIKHSAMAKEKMPLKKHYDAVVVYGATTSRVKGRIEFLVHLYNKGVTWDKIYLLGSTRDLKIGNEADQEMSKALEKKGLAPTEMVMMNELWHQTKMPEQLRTISVVSIQSGERPDGTRANTEDTLVDMIKDGNNVEGKSFLFISNNPYICYQDAVAKRALDKYKVMVETVGEAIAPNETMENVVDTLARCLTNIKHP